MSKSSKQKKNKVQNITEEEYVAYLSALKANADKPSTLIKTGETDKN